MGKSRIIDIASAGLSLPPDLVSGAVRITLLGQELLKVVNHRGIVVYQPQQIILRVSGGRLIICGRDLTMAELDDEQLVAEGHIATLSFEEADHAD